MGQTCMWQHLFEHFTNEGYFSFLEDVTITFINKTGPKDPNQHEQYGRHFGKKIEPLGFKVEDVGLCWDFLEQAICVIWTAIIG